MIFHAEYSAVPEAEVERLVAGQELGRLVTVGADGAPHIGLYPFVAWPDRIETHLVRADEQIADLRARAGCLFEVDEVLGVVPSYWVHPEYGGSATAYHRTAIFECRATVIEDPGEIAAQQMRLMARYQPEGGFRPLDPGDPLYRGALARIAAVRLGVVARRVKFKLGQNRPEATRRRIIAELRQRGRPADERAACALESTLGSGAADGHAGPVREGQP